VDVLPPLVVGALTNGMYITINSNVECDLLEPFKSNVDMKVVNELTCPTQMPITGKPVTFTFSGPLGHEWSHATRLRSVTVGFDRL
jgi:hypothetical protein